ncbi:hypothetical protein C5F50_05075 [Nitrosopumilus ureiphilus]|uniref:Uncharacterized protein n=2 Tax=Nitrosopumilus ureiphilus TaxID=1470067 RepID=A0A7D5M4R2_9ARCH|nr:hypothetical protein C5F50_05075 [Nitrosopumilus ureiphilus]
MSVEPDITIRDTSLTPDEIHKIRSIAKESVKNSPTFNFDGKESSLKLISIDAVKNNIRVDLKFVSENIGYGNRSDALLLTGPVTHHVRMYLNSESFDVLSRHTDYKKSNEGLWH